MGLSALSTDKALTPAVNTAADVLLNLGMLLFHQSLSVAQRLTPLPEGLMSKALRARAPARTAEAWPEPEPPKIVTGLVALPGELPKWPNGEFGQVSPAPPSATFMKIALQLLSSGALTWPASPW